MNAVQLMFTLCLMATISSAQEDLVLDMSDHSIDDMYSGCSENMAQKVQQEYFPREYNDSFFQKAWESAEPCTEENLEIIKNKSKDKELTRNHLQAICVYTQEYPKVYAPFNQAVQNDADKYGTEQFQYHALHFWLTSAIQILSVNKSCRVTYRRSGLIFSGEVNQIIRLGQFASSSKKTDLYHFGTKTCFNITTCFGAYLKAYSTFQKEEREVLIPPYEKFKITNIITGSYGNLDYCNKIFVLESAGLHSNLNCRAVNHNQGTRSNVHIIVVLQILTALTWGCFGNGKM